MEASNRTAPSPETETLTMHRSRPGARLSESEAPESATLRARIAGEIANVEKLASPPTAKVCAPRFQVRSSRDLEDVLVELFARENRSAPERSVAPGTAAETSGGADHASVRRSRTVS